MVQPKKFIKLGGSLAITISPAVLELLDWRTDDPLAIEQGDKDGELKIINLRISLESSVESGKDVVHKKD